jgi:hypothetical protein
MGAGVDARSIGKVENFDSLAAPAAISMSKSASTVLKFPTRRRCACSMR